MVTSSSPTQRLPANFLPHGSITGTYTAESVKIPPAESIAPPADRRWGAAPRGTLSVAGGGALRRPTVRASLAGGEEVQLHPLRGGPGLRWRLLWSERGSQNWAPVGRKLLVFLLQGLCPASRAHVARINCAVCPLAAGPSGCVVSGASSANACL